MVWSLAVERVAGKQTGTGSLGMDYQRVCMSFYLLIILTFTQSIYLLRSAGS